MKIVKDLDSSWSFLLVALAIMLCYASSSVKAEVWEKFLGVSSEDIFQSNKHPLQIGDRWNRLSLESDRRFAKSIFTMSSGFTQKQGLAIYLGKYAGQHLFITNKHVFSEDERCSFSVVIYSNESEIPLMRCNGFSFSLSAVDITFLTMDPDRFAEWSELKPLRLRARIAPGESLILRTIDRETGMVAADFGPDCHALDTHAKEMKDLDRVNTTKITSWSIPVGCDAEPGDSGAPVFNHEDEVVGILWTGANPRDHYSSDEVEVAEDLRAATLWEEFNLIVPSSRILTELERELKNLESNSLKNKRTLRILGSFLKSYQRPL